MVTVPDDVTTAQNRGLPSSSSTLGIVFERKKRRMTTSSTIEDFVSRILLVMRYFPSSSDRFFCHRSIADCMLGGRKGGRGEKGR